MWHRAVWQFDIDSSDEPALRQKQLMKHVASSFLVFTVEYLSYKMTDIVH
jgi:hypothetical protein